MYNYFGDFMRLRNNKNAHNIINDSTYVLKDNYKSNYKSLFKNNNDLEIEIGMGKGDFIINKALANPDINYIGIEKYATVLVSALKKIGTKEIPNLKILNIDANEIENYFDKDVSKIYLNFSDPWPKNRHQNRRLTSPIFLSKYEKIFKDDYRIEMKTDNDNLFEYSLQTLSNNYIFEEVILDLHSKDVENIETEYEKKFSNLGYSIHKLTAIHKIDNK